MVRVTFAMSHGHSMRLVGVALQVLLRAAGDENEVQLLGGFAERTVVTRTLVCSLSLFLMGTIFGRGGVQSSEAVFAVVQFPVLQRSAQTLLLLHRG